LWVVKFNQKNNKNFKIILFFLCKNVFWMYTSFRSAYNHIIYCIFFANLPMVIPCTKMEKQTIT
jgi:hypothetical protein